MTIPSRFVLSILSFFVLACTKDITNPSTGSVTALNCSSASFSAKAASGSSYTAKATVPYMGGSGQAYEAGAAIASSGVTGLTATLDAGTLASGDGTASFTVTGTPSATGTASFAIQLGGQSCSLAVPVAASSAQISGLTCLAAPATGKSGTAYTGTVNMAYTGGNGGDFGTSTASSKGVEGLTATVAAGKLKSGDGTLTYTIAGIPTSNGSAIFNLSLGGKSCTVTVEIETGSVVVANPAKDTVVIAYAGSSVSINNPYSSDGVSVTASGADVVVKSTNSLKEMVYLLSGTAIKGSFKLYSNYKYNLTLKNLNLTNITGSAINVQSDKKGTIHVLGATSNTLTDGTAYTTSTEDQKGAFFSEGQLAFVGKGVLNINANYKHGIASDDFISISESNIVIKTTVNDAIHANDYFLMESGTLGITSAGDGIVAEEGYVAINGGSVNIQSVDEGIAAPYEGTDTKITPYINIKGGKISINTTGEKANGIKSVSYTNISTGEALTISVSGKGSKGIKTGGNLTINAGNIKLSTSGAAFYDATTKDIAAPAAINVDGNLIINGGTLTVGSSGTGGKGVNVDGTATINNGSININVSGAKYTYSSALTSEGKGLKTDEAFVMNDGTLTISATDDGVKSNKSILVNGGKIDVTKSYEGMESILITIAGGVTNLVASNDGINTSYGTVSGGTESNDNSSLTVSGGVLIATGSDAVDSNGNFYVKGGTAIFSGREGIDINGNFVITGGTVLGAGPNSGMTKAMSTSSTQVGMFLKSTSALPIGSIFYVEDANGKELITFKTSIATSMFHFSHPSLAKNAAYKIYFGGTYTGGTFLGLVPSWGIHTGGTYSKTNATLKSSPTTSGSSTVNTISF